MKKLVLSVVASAMIILLGSCGSTKNVTYLQNLDSISLASSRGLYDAKIMPKDQLTITVSTTDYEASRPFNLTVHNNLGANGNISNNGGSLQQYVVDNSGFINFPVVGKVHVEGLSVHECEDLIKSKIQPYLARTENPIVTVRMASYRITVIGEVNRPGVIPVTTERMSILEALAQAGDLTIYGLRDNIALIRTDAAGEKHQIRLNLNDANIINSPYYYVQQDDVLYVEPNKVKAKNSGIGSSTTIWFSFISIATSVASLLVNVLRN